MALLQANIKIQGTRPLLFNCFKPEILSIEKRERTGVAGNDPEEWQRSFMATKKGELYVDQSYVFGCLREAARYTKKGRGSIQSSLVATLQVLNEMILFNRILPRKLDKITTDSSEPIYIDIRSVKNPSTKGRNIRYRLALSPGWETNFSVIWDNTLVNREQMRAICHDAGILVGIADGRSLGFGRFDITSFEVEEFNAKKTTA